MRARPGPAPEPGRIRLLDAIERLGTIAAEQGYAYASACLICVAEAMGNNDEHNLAAVMDQRARQLYPQSWSGTTEPTPKGTHPLLPPDITDLPTEGTHDHD